mmetsp:Transcript_22314/g.27575  ORF Transcript_22314/g.27575 Transcript_22314/m.27575 type:complete len:195 (-) Transcript_22314:162-746(-)
MPKTSYRVKYAIALGDMAALGNIALAPNKGADVCGRVLELNCGGEKIDAVVASSCNIGAGNCGVDLVGDAWDKATGGKPPGVVYCSSVALTEKKSMSTNDVVCAARPDSTNNYYYYASLAMFNTGKRIVKATLNGVAGVPNSNNSPYWSFSNSRASSLSKFTVHTDNGESYSKQVGDCIDPKAVYIWGCGNNSC